MEPVFLEKVGIEKAHDLQVTVGIYHWVMFRSPEYFAEPDEYIPERWLGQDARFKNDNLAVVQPFSYGPRNCIGRK